MSETVATPSHRLNQVKARIADACARAGRDSSDITLIAVSKTHPASTISALLAEGQTDFGENYVQEAREKIPGFKDARLCWHFIGHIQSNKCGEIARLFDWVHSVDRCKTARRLSESATSLGKILNVMIEVNLHDESNKAGVPKNELPGLLDEVASLKGIRIRGLMAIPEAGGDLAGQRAPFAELRRLLCAARDRGLDMDCLSMGMSADLEAAILEGATHVRVGTALFGPRTESSKR